MSFIEISEKKGYLSDAYGDRIILSKDGTLSINMYDGMTKLNVEEAKQLVTMINEWIDNNSK